MVRRQKSVKIPAKLKWHAAPLKGSFMVTAMLGLLISIYYVFPQNANFGFTFMIIFAAMFVASLISMTKAPVIEV